MSRPGSADALCMLNALYRLQKCVGQGKFEGGDDLLAPSTALRPMKDDGRRSRGNSGNLGSGLNQWDCVRKFKKDIELRFPEVCLGCKKYCRRREQIIPHQVTGVIFKESTGRIFFPE